MTKNRETALPSSKLLLNYVSTLGDHGCTYFTRAEDMFLFFFILDLNDCSL